MDFIQKKCADTVAFKVVIRSFRIGLDEELHTAVKTDHILIVFEVAADKSVFDLIENIDVFVIILELCAGVGGDVAGGFVKVSVFPDQTQFRNIFPTLFAPGIGEGNFAFGTFDGIS